MFTQIIQVSFDMQMILENIISESEWSYRERNM